MIYVKIKKEYKNKKWQIGYRTASTVYPCFLPDLGEFDRSWSYRFATAKVLSIYAKTNTKNNILIYYRNACKLLAQPFQVQVEFKGAAICKLVAC